MTRSRWADVQIGLAIPDRLGGRELSIDQLASHVAELGVGAIELDARAVEAWLGAPPEPALLHPPEDSFETGLLPIEEEVFRDELDLARSTFAGYVRDWRRTVALGPLDSARDRLIDAGARVEGLRWHGLADLADDEIELAFRMASSLGARVLLTEASLRGGSRLAPLAARCQMTIGFQGEEGSSAEAVERVLVLGDSAGVGIDIGVWEAAGNGSPLAFLEQHAGRVTHVHLTDRRTRDWSLVPFGSGDAPIREVLHAIRDRRWAVPAIIALDRTSDSEPGWMAASRQALDYCRRCLVD
jgi:sugar phosphate isomerase/epimerase